MKAARNDLPKKPILVVKAPAKINLGLKVVRRRSDGFHDIVSLCQTVNLCDTLEFYADRIDSMCCTDKNLNHPENLVYQALRLFRARNEQCNYQPVHILLKKAIPIGSGLGGGSADAAAVLRAMVKITNSGTEIDTLAQWGADIGSDVPFLVRGGTAVMRGRGEIVEPVLWEHKLHYVISYPGVAVDTKWAYDHLRGKKLTINSPYDRFLCSLGGGRVDTERLVAVLENDFQPIVERAKPIVADIRAKLQAAGAIVTSLTGSGSAVYGLFDDRIAASSVYEELTENGIRSFYCRPYRL